MWRSLVLVVALAPSIISSSGVFEPITADSDGCQASTIEEHEGTRGNSLLQMASTRGVVRASVEDVDAAVRVENLDRRDSGVSLSMTDHGIDVSLSPWGIAWDAEADPSLHSKPSFAQADVLDTASSGRFLMHTAYQAHLQRAVAALEVARNASSQELEDLIDQFIAAHVASTDHCPAELMEAKHQLNDLHKQIKDLADLVKTIEEQIQEAENKRKRANDDINKLKKQHGEDKKKSAEEREEARKFLATLKNEMAMLKAIAQPEVTMNISSRKVDTDGGAIALLQDPRPSNAVQASQNMVQKTREASDELLTCIQGEQRLALVQSKHLGVKTAQASAMMPNCSANMSAQVTVGNLTAMMKLPYEIVNGSYRSYHCSNIDNTYGGTIWLHCTDGKVSADTRGCLKFPNQAHCDAQKKALEETYVKAYVGLSRLIDQYEKKVADTSKDDAAKKQYDDKSDPKKKQAEDATKDIAKKTKELQELRAKLDDAWNAEKKLRQHIEKLKQECALLGNTTQYLSDVRTAIHALEACPGLERPEFHIPLYQGFVSTFTLDPSQTDAQTDVAMSSACEVAFGSMSRAAEVSEIEGHTIEGAPLNNTAAVPLLGKCPGCEGGSNKDTGSTAVSGHARVCWFPGKPLSLPSREESCFQNTKAIMCVTDRGDVRKLAGFATTPPTTTMMPPR